MLDSSRLSSQFYDSAPNLAIKEPNHKVVLLSSSFAIQIEKLLKKKRQKISKNDEAQQPKKIDDQMLSTLLLVLSIYCV
jgi:hypothetical protein